MTSTSATLAGTLRLEAAPIALTIAAERLLRVAVPAAARRSRFGYAARQRAPEYRYLAKRIGDSLTAPRGALKAIRTLAAELGYSLAVEDKRTDGDPLEVAFKGELRDYQAEAVARFVEVEQGLVVLPCGGGKTSVALAAIARVSRSALVLVHTADLAAQWHERIRSSLDLEAGLIGAGKREIRPVTIAMVQSLSTLDPIDLEELGARFGLVVADEAHHLPAETFGAVLAAMPARYRLALSATPERADGLPVETFTGPICYQATQADLVREGWLAGVTVCPIITGCRPFAEPDDVHGMTCELIEDADRLELVVRIAAECTARGRMTLVLSARIEHIARIVEALRARGIAAAALTGKTPANQRAPLLDALRSGEVSVLVASTVADEGLDAAGLERIVLALPARASSRTQQRIGRLMRPHPSKAPPVLFDLLDDHPIARSQWRARRSTYERLQPAVRVESPRRLEKE